MADAGLPLPRAHLTLRVLHPLQPHLGLITELPRRHKTARDVVMAYLGEDAGRRVLDGRIRLGAADRIPAATRFNDLRGSTAMAQ